MKECTLKYTKSLWNDTHNLSCNTHAQIKNNLEFYHGSVDIVNKLRDIILEFIFLIISDFTSYFMMYLTINALFSLNVHYLDLFVLVRPFNDWQAMWINNTKTSNGIWITEVELFFCSWLYKLDIRIILCFRWSSQIKPYAYKPDQYKAIKPSRMSNLFAWMSNFKENWKNIFHAMNNSFILF